MRRGAGAVERARLESGCTVYSRTEGSNPSLSARNESARLVRALSFLMEGWMRTLAREVRKGFDKFAGSEFGRPKGARRAETMDGFGQSLPLRHFRHLRL